MATGSPFAPLDRPGGKQVISQSNNLYAFPGVGLGAIVSNALRVTDRMFAACSRALTDMVTPEQRAQGALLPGLRDVREASFNVALAVAKEARDSGLGRMVSDEDLARIIRRAQWQPRFLPYRPNVCPTPQSRW
jgi:malate dehydrogenase (oxaloacetate-decarboxylating)